MLGVSFKMNNTVRSKPLPRYRACSGSSEHYIHLRLKSSLQSGPKENLYSGILEGGKVRRQASLDSEVKTRMLCNETQIQSTATIQSPTSPQLSPKMFAAERVSIDRFFPSQEKVSISKRMCMNGSASVDTTHPSLTSNHSQSLQQSPSSVEAEKPDWKSGMKSPLSSYMSGFPMKDATVNVIDFKKRRKTNEDELIKPQPVMPHDPHGFVKRAAWINACARVAALSQGAPLLQKHSSTNLLPAKADQLRKADQRQKSLLLNEMSATYVAGSKQGVKLGNTRKRSSATTNWNQNNSKKKKGNGSANEECFNPSLQCSPSSVEDLATAGRACSRPEIFQSNSEHEHADSVVSSESEASLASTLQSKKEMAIQFNNLGLLCTGDCIHPSKRVLLTTEGYIPARIMPIVIPAKTSTLPPQQSRKRIKLKPIKGDNSWAPVEQPIKTVYIRQPNAKKVARHYFSCIKRKNDKVNVRDRILIRSGKKNPYVAMIASIWQETDGIMLTVFWYYRPEDTTSSVAHLVEEMELMASQHHDDVSVACIDDSCIVLGLSQYCRYKAAQKRRACGLSRSSIVPRLNLEDHRHQLQSEQPHDTLNQSVTPLLHNRVNEDKLFSSGKSVYFCYRAYNHISGRIIKGGGTYKY